MKSIKLRLLINFSFLIIGVGLVLGFISINTGKDLLVRDAEKTVSLLAKEGTKTLESRTGSMIASLNILAMQKEIVSMDLEKQLEILKEYLGTMDMLDLAIVQPDGTAHYTDGSESQLGDRDYVIKAFQGQPSISDVLISRVTNEPVIMAAVPIKENDQVVGVLIGRKDGNALSALIQDAGYGTKGYAYILNKDGTYMAHKNKDLVLGQVNPVILMNDDSKYITMGRAVKKIIELAKGIIEYEDLDDNSKKEALYAGFEEVEGTNWIYVVTANQNEVLAAVPKLQNTIVITLALCLLLGLGVIYILGYYITKPMITMAKLSQKISSLDITENVSPNFLRRKDESGILANAMQAIMDNLRKIISEVTDSSTEVASTAEELTASAEQSAMTAEEVSRNVEEIAKGASDQAASTETGSVQAMKLGDLIDQNRGQVENLNKTSNKVINVVNDGLLDVERLSEITQVNDAATKEIYDIISKTKESAEQISEASNVIAAISEQTNLLALNASIEAARAGEAGKGFSVVASEIKKLAGQSAESTKYIDEIIGNLQGIVTKAVESIERVREITTEQSNSVSNTKVKYISISEEMKETMLAVEQLNRSEEEMALAKNEILNMLQNLSAIAEENAAGTEEASSSMVEQSATMEEIARSSERLTQLSGSLQEIIMRFKL